MHPEIYRIIDRHASMKSLIIFWSCSMDRHCN